MINDRKWTPYTQDINCSIDLPIGTQVALLCDDRSIQIDYVEGSSPTGRLANATDETWKIIGYYILPEMP